MEELEDIVASMLENGDSREEINKVIKEYNEGKLNGAVEMDATATPEKNNASKNTDLNLENSSSGSLETQNDLSWLDSLREKSEKRQKALDKIDAEERKFNLIQPLREAEMESSSMEFKPPSMYELYREEKGENKEYYKVDNPYLQTAIDKIAGFGAGGFDFLSNMVDSVEAVGKTITETSVDIYNALSDEENQVSQQYKRELSQAIESYITLDDRLKIAAEELSLFETEREDDEGVYGALEQGKYLEALDRSVSQLFKALPSVVAAYGGKIGLISIGASSAGQHYEELEKAREEGVIDSEAKAYQLFGTALVQGGVELSSELVTRGLFGGVGKMLPGKIGKQVASTLGGRIAAGAFFEGSSEVASQEVNNAIDQMWGINRFYDQEGNFDGKALLMRTFDTFLVSAALGGGIQGGAELSGAQKALQADRLMSPEYRKTNAEIAATIAEQEDLNIGVNDPVVSDRIIKLKALLRQRNKGNRELVDSYTKDELIEVLNLKQQQSDLEASAKNLNLTEKQKKLNENLQNDINYKLNKISQNKLNELNEKKKKDTLSFAKSAEVLGLESVELDPEAYNKKAKEIGAEEINNDASMSSVEKSQAINELENKDFSETTGGFFVSDGKMYFNVDKLIKLKQFNVGAHEVLHPILNYIVGNSKNQGKLVEQFKKQLTKEQLEFMEMYMRERGYTGDKYSKEYLNAFSDAIRIDFISYKENFGTKIKDFLTKILRSIPGIQDNVSFESGRGVYEFMKEYSKASEKGKLSKKVLDAIEKETKGKKLTDEQKADDEIISQFSNSEKGKKASEEVQRLFNEKPRDWENLVIEQMRPITAKLVERRRDVTGFDREDLLRDFEVGKRGVLDLIRSYDPNKNDSLAAYINTFLSFRAQESSKRILKPVFESDVTEEKGVAAQEDDISIEDAVDQSFKPTVEEKSKLRRQIKLPDEQVEKVRQAVRKTFGTKLPALDSPEFKKALRKAFDVELFKELKTNVFKTRDEYRNFLRENWKALYDAIPQETLNQSFAPFREEVLDESGKQKREKTPEGERIFRKKNITREEFLDYFFNPNVGGSTRGTRKDAIVRMLAQELGFDATMETIQEPKVAEKIAFANPSVKVPELSDKVNRKQDLQFSTTERSLVNKSDWNKASEEQKLEFLLQAYKNPDEASEYQFEKYEDLPDEATSNMYIEKDILERRLVTEEEWDTADEDQRLDLLLQAYKDPDDVDGLQFEDFKDLPDVATSNMYIEPDIDIISEAEQIQFSNAEIVEEFGGNENNYKVDSEESAKRYIKNWAKILKKGYFPPGLVNITTLNSVINKSFSDKAGYDSAFRTKLRTLAKKEFQGYKFKDSKTFDEFMKLNSKQKSKLKKQWELDYYKNFYNKNPELKKFPISKANSTYGSSVTTSKWKKLSNKVFRTKKNKQNETNLINFWQGINNTFKNSTAQEIKDLMPAVALLLEGSQKEGSTAHRAGAQTVATIKDDFESDGRKNAEGVYVKWYKDFYEKGGNDRALQWEHAVTSTYSYKYLLRSVLDGTFEKKLPGFLQNYTQIPMPAIISKILEEAGYKHDMPINFDELMNNPGAWVDRYINEKVKEELRKAGLSENWFEENIRMFDGSKIFESKTNSGVQYSSALDLDMNKILENKTSIAASETISDAKARILGAKKRGDLLITPSADDFVGLLYYTLGKGKAGEKAMKFYNEHLLSPFAQAMSKVSKNRIEIGKKYLELKKQLKIIPKTLKSKVPGEEFTQEQAVRVYIWNKQDIRIPGLKPIEEARLLKYINENKNLKQFADRLLNINVGFEYAKPGEAWTSGNITSDLKETLNTTKRAFYLDQWQRNVDIIFSKGNLNKLEAAFGREYRLALENSLHRMKTGRNRSYGPDSLTGRFTDWINGSVGAIMFFHTRSALLQTISSINFINFSDNNIFAAAKAFSNQKQYWSDFSMLFNSDFLIDRRDGLKMDVNEADLADVAKESGARGVISKLLKFGFTPTQLADSFAIASGGASFYRNRFNSLVKDGMDKKAAEKIAFQEFRETAEESQQSSRPDKISQQQSGPLGRILLAFANTPSQYARIMKKAALDLKNGRGDTKTNISKILYYGAMQNLIFNSLQQALFAISFGDEEDEDLRDSKLTNVVNGMSDSILRGMGFPGAIASTLKNVAIKMAKDSNKTNLILEILKLSPPISDKARKLASAKRSYDWNKDEMLTKGVSIKNPAVRAVGETVSAITNIPLDRAIRKIDNVNSAITKDLEFYQRLALMSGWSEWDLGITTRERNIAKNKKGIKTKSLKTKSLKVK